MIDIANIDGIVIVSAVFLLLSWLIYPLVLEKFTQYIQSPLGVRMVLVLSIFLGFIGVQLAFKPVLTKPSPPNLMEVKHEFSQYEKNWGDRALGKEWRPFELSAKTGWTETGYNFDPGDYAWIVSYDSCLVKVESFAAIADTSITLTGECLQLLMPQERSIVSVKVSLEYPPLYNHRKANVFVKRWSRRQAELPLLAAGWGGIIFMFLVSLLGAPAVQLELATFKARRRQRKPRKKVKAFDIKDDASQEPIEVEEMDPNEFNNYKNQEIQQKPKSPAEEMHVVATKIALEIQQAYVSGDMKGPVERWQERMHDKRFRDLVTSKTNNQKAMTAYLRELSEYDEAQSDLGLSKKKFRKKETTLDAEIVENEVRVAKATKEKREYEKTIEPSQAKDPQAEAKDFIDKDEELIQKKLEHDRDKIEWFHKECTRFDKEYPTEVAEEMKKALRESMVAQGYYV